MQVREARAAAASLRGDPDLDSERRQGPGDNARSRVAVAGHSDGPRDQQWDLLHQPAPLPREGRPAGGRSPHLQAQCRELRRDAGETVEEVSRFLDHSSLAVTTTYLRRLEGEEDRSWAKVAEAIGVA